MRAAFGQRAAAQRFPRHVPLELRVSILAPLFERMAHDRARLLPAQKAREPLFILPDVRAVSRLNILRQRRAAPQPHERAVLQAAALRLPRPALRRYGRVHAERHALLRARQAEAGIARLDFRPERADRPRPQRANIPRRVGSQRAAHDHAAPLRVFAAEEQLEARRLAAQRHALDAQSHVVGRFVIPLRIERHGAVERQRVRPFRPRRRQPLVKFLLQHQLAVQRRGVDEIIRPRRMNVDRMRERRFMARNRRHGFFQRQSRDGLQPYAARHAQLRHGIVAGQRAIHRLEAQLQRVHAFLANQSAHRQHELAALEAPGDLAVDQRRPAPAEIVENQIDALVALRRRFKRAAIRPAAIVHPLAGRQIHADQRIRRIARLHRRRQRVGLPADGERVQYAVAQRPAHVQPSLKRHGRPPSAAPAPSVRR